MINDNIHKIINGPVTFHSAGLFVSDVPWAHAPRKNPNEEIIIGISGILFLEVDNLTYEIKENDFIYIPAGVSFRGHKTSNKGLSFYWFHFQFPQDKKEFTMLPLPSDEQQIAEISLPLFSTTINLSKAIILINQLISGMKSVQFNKAFLHYLVTSILLEISEAARLSQEVQILKEPRHRFLHFVMEWIQMNITNPLTIEDIANHFGYNKAYLSHTFSKNTGMTISQFILQARLDKAKSLLLNSNDSITKIAIDCGFKDEKYFMRVFKKQEQMTPSAFRSALRHIKLNNI